MNGKIPNYITTHTLQFSIKYKVFKQQQNLSVALVYRLSLGEEGSYGLNTSFTEGCGWVGRERKTLSHSCLGATVATTLNVPSESCLPFHSTYSRRGSTTPALLSIYYTLRNLI